MYELATQKKIYIFPELNNPDSEGPNVAYDSSTVVKAKWLYVCNIIQKKNWKNI